MGATDDHVADPLHSQPSSDVVSRNPKHLPPPEVVEENAPVFLKEIDNAWTAGDNPDVSHRNVIDAGATGEVHEVYPLNQSESVLIS